VGSCPSPPGRSLPPIRGTRHLGVQLNADEEEVEDEADVGDQR
jgi:hypothetical protein